MSQNEQQEVIEKVKETKKTLEEIKSKSVKQYKEFLSATTHQKDPEFLDHLGLYYENLLNNQPRKKYYLSKEKEYQTRRNAVYSMLEDFLNRHSTPNKPSTLSSAFIALIKENINSRALENSAAPNITKFFNRILEMQTQDANFFQLALEDEKLLQLIYQFVLNCTESPLITPEKGTREEQKKAKADTIDNYKKWTRKLIGQCEDNKNSTTTEEQLKAGDHLIKAAGEGNPTLGIAYLRKVANYQMNNHGEDKELCLVNPAMAILSLMYAREDLDVTSKSKSKKRKDQLHLFTQILEEPHNEHNLAVHLAYVRSNQLFNHLKDNPPSKKRISYNCAKLATASIAEKKEILRDYLKSDKKNLSTILRAQETADWRFCPLPCDNLTEFVNLIGTASNLAVKEKLFVEVFSQKVQPPFFKRVLNKFGIGDTSFNANDAKEVENAILSLFAPNKKDIPVTENTPALKTFIEEILTQENGSPAAAELILDRFGDQLDAKGLSKLARMDKSGAVFRKVFANNEWYGLKNWLFPSKAHETLRTTLTDAWLYSTETEKFQTTFTKISSAHKENHEINKRISEPAGTFGVDYSRFVNYRSKEASPKKNRSPSTENQIKHGDNKNIVLPDPQNNGGNPNENHTQKIQTEQIHNI